MGERIQLQSLVSSGIVAHDDEWQFPAITEKNAYEVVRSHLFDVKGVVYLAFPWATLLDKYNTKRSSAAPLIAKLKEISARIAPNTRVVTVCQHIHMMKFIDIFFDHRVTDIFWTHTVKNGLSVSQDRKIDLYPFPLYSVQFPKKEALPLDQKRAHLFSFIGARANQWYLTESRNWILDLLGDDERGLVVGRDNWHFNKVVYDYQIRKSCNTADQLVDATAAELFKETLRETTFSLCPSGSGPNSIRLWESIAAGSIPVILADTYLPPGSQKMWNEAAVYCEESPEAIKALPDRLEAIASDPELLAHKREMLGQLWILYGMDTFIYDIQILYLQIANGDFPAKAGLDGRNINDPLVKMAETMSRLEDVSKFDLSMFLNASISALMIDHEGFKQSYSTHKSVRKLLAQAVQKNVNPTSIDRYKKAKVFMGFDETTISLSKETVTPKTPLKVMLYGKHSNRTPLSYQPYLSHSDGLVEIVGTAKEADFIVTGFNIDFVSDTHALNNHRIDNYNAKHIVLSEEPLWDVIWSKGYKNQNRKIESKTGDIPYHFLNHMNSNVFAFDKIPYFITTNDKFFVRYGNYFRRNAKLSVSDLMKHWSDTSIRAAFYNEIRNDDRYGVEIKEDDVYGLCLLRTFVAKNCKKGKIVRVGGGWSKAVKKRQALPDWHLDKLNALDGKTLIVSGLENTHQKHYVTEKIFDAFSVNAIPIYSASPNHRVHELFPDGGFINIFGMTGEKAAKFIDSFVPDEAFAKQYLKSQRRMADLFSKPEFLVQERKRLMVEFIKAAKKIAAI
ncbi:MAG: exostosin family protein [Litorimonas sp.]